MPTDAISQALPVHPLQIIGLGGHGRVVADAWLATHPGATLMGYDDAPSWQGRPWLGEQLCMGTAQTAKSNGLLGPIHIAVGNNAIRERLAGHLELSLSDWATVVHPRSVLSAFASVGAGSLLAANAVVAPQAAIGQGVIVNHAAVVDHDVIVGDFCHVAPGAVLGGGASLGKRVLLGAGAVVLPGVRICDDVVIGAGAVVVRDVLRPGVWRGVPAQEH
jgi:UDP-perosamine 4-acetyltransferase